MRSDDRFSQKEKGSITVEMSISLFAFIVAFFAMMCLVKFVILYGYMQDTITDIAMEISVADYLVSGNDFQRIGFYQDMGNVFYDGYSSDGAIGPNVESVILSRNVHSSCVKGEFINLLSESTEDSSKLLEGLGLVGGIDGIDFSESRLEEAESNKWELKIVARYRVKISFLPSIVVKNKAVTRTWW